MVATWDQHETLQGNLRYTLGITGPSYSISGWYE